MLAVAPNVDENYDAWDYFLLTELARQGGSTKSSPLAEANSEGTMTSEQVVAIVRQTLGEVLFDIVQNLEASFSETLGYARTESGEVKLPTMSMLSGTGDGLYVRATEGIRPAETRRLPQTWTLAVLDEQKRIQGTWEQWTIAGFSRYSPNQAPAIANLSELQKRTSPEVYARLAALLKGELPLRDLAVLTKRSALDLAKSLAPFVHQNVVVFKEVPDLVAGHGSIGDRPSSSQRSSSPLVLCVDDSPQTLQILEAIALKEGWRFEGIAQSWEALPNILESEPALIFLDVVMPGANGYELCGQIRRIDRFARTPIVLLSGNFIDRVRGKFVGATDYLKKPIEAPSIRDVLHRYRQVGSASHRVPQ